MNINTSIHKIIIQLLWNNMMIFNQIQKDLWAKCVEQKVFDYIPENKLDKTKEVFEMNVYNYQTQILQQDGQNNSISLYPTLIRSIQNDVNSLKDITRDNVHQQRQESFEQEVESKQQEFNTMIIKMFPRLLNLAMKQVKNH